MLDIETLIANVHEYVERAVAPLQARIKELESREPIKGLDGKDGASITIDDVIPLIAEQVRAAVEAIPAPKDGKDGENGKDGTDGKDAEPVIVADVVAELIESKLLTPVLDLCATEAVAKHMEAHPVRNGKDGAPVTDEQVSRHVKEYMKDNPPARGDDGKDGIGLAGAMIDRNGELVVTLTNGEAKSLGPVVGKDGDNGKDGADFTDFAIDYDGGRTITIKSRNGEITKRLPIPMDKGYYRDGMASEQGDILTNGGNAWIALRDTKAKPCLENKDDWRLFARKGRDGKDGINGIDKTKPVDLKKGKGDD